MERGTKVKVICSSDSTSHINRIYAGKKGKVIESTEPYELKAYVEFKDGNAYFFYLCDLVVCKPKRHKFDLDRALAGDEVVTRKGEKIASIRVINNQEWCLRVEFENGDTGLFTKEGKYDFDLKKDEYDLFMKHPATESKPVTDLPRYTAELLSQAVPNPVADGIDRLKSELNQDCFMNLSNDTMTNIKAHPIKEKAVPVSKEEQIERVDSFVKVMLNTLNDSIRNGKNVCVDVKSDPYSITFRLS